MRTFRVGIRSGTNRLTPETGRKQTSADPYSPNAANASLNARSPGAPFFDRDGGAALVDIDQRHVEPRALLQELQIARAIDIAIE